MRFKKVSITRKTIAEFMFVCGMIFITIGFFLIYLPAGVLVAGISLLILSILMVRGADKNVPR